MREIQKKVVNDTLKGEVFKNENLGFTARVLKNEDGSISINAEDTAIGYGWTEIKNGKEYVRWRTINAYAKEIGFSQDVAKGDYIPESLFYRLGFKASNKAAEAFQNWLAMDVIPSIRKHGVYITDGYTLANKEVSRALNEFKGQVATLVNDIFDKKMEDVREYYKINSCTKVDISTYIKKRLGISKADEEYEQVKTRVFLILNITKWEDLDVDSYREIMPIVDESIRIIKLDRPQQTTLFD